MRKYGESKTTRIMMATVPHVISGLGLRKFQADGFLLTRVYLKKNPNLFQIHNCCGCSVVTVYVTYNAISRVQWFVLHISSCHSMSAVPNMAVFRSS